MRWNSLNGVPRGSKNGSGAIIRMRTVRVIFSRIDGTVASLPDERMPAESSEPSPTRRYALLALKLSVSIVLLALLFSRIDARRLWQTARLASVPWLLIGLLVYAVNVVAAVWRWQLLLNAQRVRVPQRTLMGSFLVAAFFNNFLPSNIGGDVIRIGDTARAAGSKTLATTVVLVDRGLGLMAL